jgi:excisionase family DNA binding protein
MGKLAGAMPNQFIPARASNHKCATRSPSTKPTPSREALDPCERTPSSLRTELIGTEPVGTAQVDTGHYGMETPLRKFESANPLLTDREACEYLRLCPRQLYELRKRGLIPFVKIGGRTVRYRLRDLDAAIEAMTVV